MKVGRIVINDKEYNLGENGTVIDGEGNLCGCVSSELVISSGLEVKGDKKNFVDNLQPEISKRLEKRMRDSEGKDSIGGAVAVGTVIGLATAVVGCIVETGRIIEAEIDYGFAQAELQSQKVKRGY